MHACMFMNITACMFMATLFLTNKRSMALVPDSLQIQVWAKHWSKQKIFLYYSRSKRQSTFIRNLIRVFQQLDTAFRYIYIYIYIYTLRRRSALAYPSLQIPDKVPNKTNIYNTRVNDEFYEKYHNNSYRHSSLLRKLENKSFLRFIYRGYVHTI